MVLLMTSLESKITFLTLIKRGIFKWRHEQKSVQLHYNELISFVRKTNFRWNHYMIYSSGVQPHSLRRHKRVDQCFSVATLYYCKV